MAINLDASYPFGSGAGSSIGESEWREMMKHLHGSASGVIRGFDNQFGPFGDSSGMQVKVGTGQCFMRGHFGKGTSQKTLPIAAAHATLARKDAVILRADFTDNNIELDVITGTPAGSPTIPTLTTNDSLWETMIAVVDVPAAAVTITAGNVVDYRVYTTAYTKFSRSTDIALANNSQVPYQLITNRAGDIRGNGTLDTFDLLRSGLWIMRATATWTVNVTGSRGIQIQKSDGSATYGSSNVINAGAGQNTVIECVGIEIITAPVSVRVMAFHGAGGTLNFLTGSNIVFTWIGP